MGFTSFLSTLLMFWIQEGVVATTSGVWVDVRRIKQIFGSGTGSNQHVEQNYVDFRKRNRIMQIFAELCRLFDVMHEFSESVATACVRTQKASIYTQSAPRSSKQRFTAKKWSAKCPAVSRSVPQCLAVSLKVSRSVPQCPAVSRIFGSGTELCRFSQNYVDYSTLCMNFRNRQQQHVLEHKKPAFTHKVPREAPNNGLQPKSGPQSVPQCYAVSHCVPQCPSVPSAKAKLIKPQPFEHILRNAQSIHPRISMVGLGRGAQKQSS